MKLGIVIKAALSLLAGVGLVDAAPLEAQDHDLLHLIRRGFPELHLDRAYLNGIAIPPLPKAKFDEFNRIADQSQMRAHHFLAKYHGDQKDYFKTLAAGNVRDDTLETLTQLHLHHEGFTKAHVQATLNAPDLLAPKAHEGLHEPESRWPAGSPSTPWEARVLRAKKHKDKQPYWAQWVQDADGRVAALERAGYGSRHAVLLRAQHDATIVRQLAEENAALGSATEKSNQRLIDSGAVSRAAPSRTGGANPDSGDHPRAGKRVKTEEGSSTSATRGSDKPGPATVKSEPRW